MKPAILGFTAFIGLALSTSLAHASFPGCQGGYPCTQPVFVPIGPGPYGPMPFAHCPPGFGPYGFRGAGPQYIGPPPFPPFNGLLLIPAPGFGGRGNGNGGMGGMGQQVPPQMAFPSHPFARSPRDYFMHGETTPDY